MGPGGSSRVTGVSRPSLAGKRRRPSGRAPAEASSLRWRCTGRLVLPRLSHRQRWTGNPRRCASTAHRSSSCEPATASRRSLADGCESGPRGSVRPRAAAERNGHRPARVRMTPVTATPRGGDPSAPSGVRWRWSKSFPWQRGNRRGRSVGVNAVAARAFGPGSGRSTVDAPLLPKRAEILRAGRPSGHPGRPSRRNRGRLSRHRSRPSRTSRLHAALSKRRNDGQQWPSGLLPLGARPAG